MKQPLTKPQAETLKCLIRFHDKNNYYPSMQEMSEEFNLGATSSIFHRLNRLEKKGWIKRKKHQPRWIEIL